MDFLNNTTFLIIMSIVMIGGMIFIRTKAKDSNKDNKKDQ